MEITHSTMSLTPAPPWLPFQAAFILSPVSINHFGNLLLPSSLFILQDVSGEAKKNEESYEIFKAPRCE